MCCVALPCCLFDLACFFLSSFSSLIKICRCDYDYHYGIAAGGNKDVFTFPLSLSHSPSSQPLVQEAEVRLIEMVHQMLSDGNLKFAQLLRNALVTKVPLYKYTVYAQWIL